MSWLDLENIFTISSVGSIGNGHMFQEQNFMGNKNLQEKIQNYELFSCKMIIQHVFEKKTKQNMHISAILYIILNSPHFMFKNASMKPWSNIVGLSCTLLSDYLTKKIVRFYRELAVS